MGGGPCQPPYNCEQLYDERQLWNDEEVIGLENRATAGKTFCVDWGVERRKGQRPGYDPSPVEDPAGIRHSFKHGTVYTGAKNRQMPEEVGAI